MLTWIFYKLVKFGSRQATLKGKRIRLLIADSFTKQLVGLMYRNGLKRDEGMLFIFGRESRWGIWMLDMKFSIDIIWLDGKCRVVEIKRGAVPCESVFSCPTYTPSKDSKYVLELASGGASRYGLMAGDVLAVKALSSQ